MVVGRIFIRNFALDTTADDVTALISKICPVEEVHLPGKTPTGWRRLFAIVVVNADEEAQQKCIKAFNNSLWRGSRIHLEVSNKEFYASRLNRERAEEKERLLLQEAEEEHYEDVENDIAHDNSEEACLTDVEEAVHINAVISKPANKIWRIKKSRDGPPLIISTVALQPATNSKSKKGVPKVISCGRKVAFDYDELGNLIQSAVQPIDDAWYDAGCTNTLDSGKEVKNEADKPKGGGARRGFGSLLAVPEAALHVPEPKPMLKPGSEDRDCCVDPHFGIDEEDARNFRQSEFLDRYDSDDDEKEAMVVLTPSVTEVELTADALEKERLRSLSVLAAVLNKPAPVKRPGPGPGPTAAKGTNANAGNKAKGAQAPAPEVDAGIVEDDVNPVGVFARLDALKNIFHKEGGVWFGDDFSSLKESVSKGNVAEDALFREAEKMGYDIRSAAAAEAGTISGAFGGGGGGSGMMFGFFDEADSSPPVAPCLVPSSSSAVSSTLVAEVGLGDDDADEEPLAMSVGVEGAATAVVMSLMDVIINAKRFCRDRSETEVTQSWRDQRDKLVIDYKRKRKDAKKKTTYSGSGGGGNSGGGGRFAEDGGERTTRSAASVGGQQGTAASDGHTMKRKSPWQGPRKRAPKKSKS